MRYEDMGGTRGKGGMLERLVLDAMVDTWAQMEIRHGGP